MDGMEDCELNSSGLVFGHLASWCEHGNEPTISIKFWGFHN
jgi:hypothetical protein